jgi:hypothetical protein
MQTRDLSVPEPTAVRVPRERCEYRRPIDTHVVAELLRVAAREI